MGTSREYNSVKFLELFLSGQDALVRFVESPNIGFSVKDPIEQTLDVHLWEVSVFDRRF